MVEGSRVDPGSCPRGSPTDPDVRNSRLQLFESSLCCYCYRAFCQRAALRPLTGRAFGDLISELDIYSLLRRRILSKRRYGRRREIVLDLPPEVIEEVYGVILLNFQMHS